MLRIVSLVQLQAVIFVVACPIGAAEVSFADGVNKAVTRIESRLCPSFAATPDTTVARKVEAFERALGVAFDYELNAEAGGVWQDTDSSHIIRFSEHTGMLRLVRNNPDHATIETDFPQELGMIAENLRTSLLADRSDSFRYEGMLATVLAEPGREPRVITRIYTYRQVLDGMAVLGEQGVASLEFNRKGELISAEIPSLAVRPFGAPTNFGALEQKIRGKVNATERIRRDSRSTPVVSGTVVDVAPALQVEANPDGCRFVPAVCVRVNYESAEGEQLRQDHVLSMRE